MATTSAQIRQAWDAAIWTAGPIFAITPNIFPHDVSPESDFDFAKLYADSVINFFTCQFRRQSEPLAFGQIRYTFQVQVDYHLQQTDAEADMQNEVIDRLEILDDLVLSALGATWSGEVDYYTGGQPSKVAPVAIDQRRCWRGGFTYTAFRTT